MLEAAALRLTLRQTVITGLFLADHFCFGFDLSQSNIFGAGDVPCTNAAFMRTSAITAPLRSAIFTPSQFFRNKRLKRASVIYFFVVKDRLSPRRCARR